MCFAAWNFRSAKGTEPISYQWRLNDGDLPGVTNSWLTVVDVQTNDTGIYTVRATNSAGGRTSASASLAISARPGFLWARQGGGTGHDLGQCVAVDAAGNACVAGSFFDTAQFGDTNVTSRGAADIFVAKYDTQGRLLWVRTAGGLSASSGDVAYAIAADADENVYVTGSISGLGDVDFGEVTLTNVVGDYNKRISPR